MRSGTDRTAGPDGIADRGDEPLNELSVPIQTKEDYDGDGWTDEQEALDLGTNPAVACPLTSTANDEEPPDAWPVDFNDDQRAAMQDVIFAFVTTLEPYGGLNVPVVPGVERVDFKGDGFINMQDVMFDYVTKLEPVGGLNATCTP